MPEQARKTLYTLSTLYQRGVREEDYEVIVVENSSDQNMGPEGIQGLEGNFSYYLRNETLPTPVFAVKQGIDKAQGSLISLMIDGARMATPGMVRAILQASRVDHNAIVAVPGYHLGQTVQQEAMNSGYNEEVEGALLESVAWRKNGYRLFDISCFSVSSQPGFFRPIAESNCLTMPRHIWNEIGGIDLNFTTSGGGLVNLDLFKRACELKHTELVLIVGEGTFHQFHGGATTGQKKEIRDKSMAEYAVQYEQLRGGKYTPPNKQAIVFGKIPANAMPYVQHSVTQAKKQSGK
jgi:hypothetical protein